MADQQITVQEEGETKFFSESPHYLPTIDESEGVSVNEQKIDTDTSTSIHANTDTSSKLPNNAESSMELQKNNEISIESAAPVNNSSDVDDVALLPSIQEDVLFEQPTDLQNREGFDGSEAEELMPEQEDGARRDVMEDIEEVQEDEVEQPNHIDEAVENLDEGTENLNEVTENLEEVTENLDATRENIDELGANTDKVTDIVGDNVTGPSIEETEVTVIGDTTHDASNRQSPQHLDDGEEKMEPDQVNIDNEHQEVDLEVTEEDTVKKSDNIDDQVVNINVNLADETITELVTPERSMEMDVERLSLSSPFAPATSEEAQSERSTDVDEISHDNLVHQLQTALAHKEQLEGINQHLQSKLIHYFRQRKSEESGQEVLKSSADHEQRYTKYLANLEELHKHYDMMQKTFHYEIEENRSLCEIKLNQVEANCDTFLNYKAVTAEKSRNSRSGKAIPQKAIDQYVSTARKKETEIVNVRLENITLKNKLKKREHQLKSKEELAEGLHLIDFEQLKIENQTLNEKIEERNEELLKLRKKITSTVQVLTHLKEKLQFIQGDNVVASEELKKAEKIVGHKRDVLTRTKQARDALRIENQRLRENCGLVGNEILLRDYENKYDELSYCYKKLDELKMQHAENTLNCKQVREKINRTQALSM